MIVKTERTSIRFIVENDWKQIKEIWEDLNLSEYARYDRPHNTDGADVQPRIAKWAANNAGTAINNGPSAALLKSLGFRQTGTETISFYKDDKGNDIVFDGGIFELTK